VEKPHPVGEKEPNAWGLFPISNDQNTLLPSERDDDFVLGATIESQFTAQLSIFFVLIILELGGLTSV